MMPSIRNKETMMVNDRLIDINENESIATPPELPSPEAEIGQERNSLDSTYRLQEELLAMARVGPLNQKTTQQDVNNSPMNKIPGVKDNPNVTPEFLKKVEEIAKALDTDPVALMAIMSVETGRTFDPGQKTPDGPNGPIGLIQFVRSTRQSLLMSKLLDPKIDLESKNKLIEKFPLNPVDKARIKQLVSEYQTTKKPKQENIKNEIVKYLTPEITALVFSNMSAVEQLDYVKQYLMPFRGKLNTVEDARLAILYQTAVGHGNDPKYVVFSRDSRDRRDRVAYEGNDGLDRPPKDGKVTVKEATEEVRKIYDEAKKPSKKPSNKASGQSVT